MNWETWLQALYTSKEISVLADYAMEQGWHEKVLEEHQRLKEHREKLFKGEENLANACPRTDVPEETAYYEHWQKMWEECQRELSENSEVLDLLHSCLRVLYPPCIHCEGQLQEREDLNQVYTCSFCYIGLDTTHKL